MLADIARSRHDILQIRRTIFIRGRTYGNKLDQSMLSGKFNIRRKLQAAFGHVTLDHILETGFIDRDTTLIQNGDFPGIHVQAQHVVPHLSQASAADQPYIPCTNHGNFHAVFPCVIS
ncbi:hypothetical protein GALL_535090 [mine drainage metagenome]|uniref:Uncharacterized protein n=1 Tax=mine drainage metagenome TaxID=410659 RepID=A0A1J5P067_9ZZZZ